MLLTIEFLKMRFWTLSNWDYVDEIADADTISDRSHRREMKNREPERFGPNLFFIDGDTFINTTNLFFVLFDMFSNWFYFLDPIFSFYGFQIWILISASDWLTHKSVWKPILSNKTQAGVYKAFSILASLPTGLKFILAISILKFLLRIQKMNLHEIERIYQGVMINKMEVLTLFPYV